MTLKKSPVPVQTLIVNGHKFVVSKRYMFTDYATGDGSKPQGSWVWAIDWQATPGGDWVKAETYVFYPLDNPQPPVTDENIPEVLKGVEAWANTKQPGGF